MISLKRVIRKSDGTERSWTSSMIKWETFVRPGSLSIHLRTTPVVQKVMDPFSLGIRLKRAKLFIRLFVMISMINTITIPENALDKNEISLIYSFLSWTLIMQKKLGFYKLSNKWSAICLKCRKLDKTIPNLQRMNK